MLAVCTWLWGTKYDASYVEKLFRGVRRHLKQPHRFLCMTERERDIKFSDGIERHAIKHPELTQIKGCFARLQVFDYGWQKNRGLNDRILNLDLDAVITGSLDYLANRPGDFVIARGFNASNPCPFNGSIWMTRAGTNGDFWDDFSIEAASAVPYDSFPDDQGWFYAKRPNAQGWTTADGIYAFGKPGWPKGEMLPRDARVVIFPGWRDPSKFTHLDWIKQHWKVR